MAAMAPSERAQFLSRVLGYEKLRTAQGSCASARRVLAAEAAGMRAAMPDAGSGRARCWRTRSDRLARAREARMARASSAAIARGARARRCREPRWDRVQREREQSRSCSPRSASPRARKRRYCARLGAHRCASSQSVSRRARGARQLADRAGAAGRAQRRAAALDALAQRGRPPAERCSRRSARCARRCARCGSATRKIETAPALEEEVDAGAGAKRAELEMSRASWRRAAPSGCATARKRRRSAKRCGSSTRSSSSSGSASSQLGEDGECPTCSARCESLRTVVEQLDEQMETRQRRRQVLQGASSSSSRRCRMRCSSSTSGVAP